MTPTKLRGITWDHVRGIGGLRAASKAYGDVRPDVRVEWSTRSLQEFADQPLDELARRFDLLHVDHPAVGHAVARESLLPLDRYLDSEALHEQEASSVGRSAESYEWRGHRWALVTDAAAQVAAYRPDLLEGAGLTVPRTWEEAHRLAAELRRHGLRAAMPAIPVDAICAFFAVCCALGDEPFARDREGVVSPEAGIEALEVLASFVSRCHPSSRAWDPPRMLEHMSTEDDVAYCPLAFGYSNYARPGFREHAIRFAPGPAGSNGVPRGTLGGAGLAVSVHGRKREEAVAFAAFVADAATQRGVYFDGGGQPGHRSAWTDPRVNSASGGFFQDTLVALDAAYLRPRFDGFIGFQDGAGALVHAYLRQPSNPETTLTRLDEAYRVSMAAGRV